MRLLIGVDIGTLTTKAGLYREDGKRLAVAAKESRLYYPKSGYVEQNPEEIYSDSCGLIRELIKKSGAPPNEISGIAFDGQMAGIMGIDEYGKAVTHYDSWLDSRCGTYVEYIRNSFEDKVIRFSGIPATVAHCPKILWWKNEKPEIYKKIDKFIQPAAYVALRLCNGNADNAYIDFTYLHFSGLYDAQNTEWSDELCRDFEVSIEKLPRIVEPTDIIGEVSEDGAEATGLAPGTPIAAGAGDQAAGFLGAGFVEPGTAIDVAGTASVFACCVDEFRPDTKYKTLLFPKAVSPELWYPHAYIAGGGLCLRWFRDNISGVKAADKSGFYQEMDKKAEEISLGSERLLFIPHLGGRNYPFDNKIRGSWTGLSWNHDDRHLFRSILESIGYEYSIYLSIEKELFPEIDFKEIRTIGGGSGSDVFNQMKADILGIPYIQLDIDEPACLGSAIIAGTSVGLYSDVNQISKEFVKMKRTYEPDQRSHKQYQKYAQLYKNSFEILEPLYNGLSPL